MMVLLRSLLFNLYIYASTVVLCILCLPVLVMPGRQAISWAVKFWTGSILKAMRILCGIEVEIRGKEFVPKGPVLVASKHQSVWETMAFFHLLEDPSFVLKRELALIPIFGFYVLKAQMISIDRAGAAKTLRQMLEQTRALFDQSRPVVIFPEGTRRAPDAPPDYKPGIAGLYDQLNCACVPVVLNSGYFWPRRTIAKQAGTIIVEFLPPIEPGLPRKAFQDELQSRMETASRRLLSEGPETEHEGTLETAPG